MGPNVCWKLLQKEYRLITPIHLGNMMIRHTTCIRINSAGISKKTLSRVSSMGYIHIALSAMKGDVAERQKGFKKGKREKNEGGKKRKEDRKDENKGVGGR